MFCCFFQGPNNTTSTFLALDCGAGIGRITKGLLLPIFDTVDMVEQNQTFLDQSRSFIGDHSSRVEHCFCCGLQDFAPEAGRYDVIWCQWVLIYLTDDDLVNFFQRCKQGLTENGVIVVKENINSSDELDFDEQDCSVTRPRTLIVDLAKRAGLSCVREEKQNSMPKDIYEVRMFAFR